MEQSETKTISSSTELQKIETGLQSFESRKKKVEELVESAKTYSINTHGYKEVSAKRKELKAERVDIEKQGKAMRDLITPITKHISSKEKELVSIIDPEEERLLSQEKEYEAEQERVKKEKEEAELAVLNSRIEALAKYNATADVGTLKVMTDIAFDSLLSEHKAIHEAAEAKRIEEEQEAIRKAEEMKAEAERIERQRAELEEREKAIKEAEEKIEAAKREEADRIERIRIEQEQEAEAAFREKIQSRTKMIVGLGLLYDPVDGFYKYGSAKIHSNDIANFADTRFGGEYDSLVSMVNSIKQEELDKHKRELEEAAERERERIQKEFHIEKERKAEEERKAAEKEAKRIARMPDKKILLEAANEIVFNTLMPAEMKTPEGQVVKDWWKSEAKAFQQRVIDYISDNL